MREITAEAITAAVRDLCVDANRVLPADLEALIQQRAQEEGNGTAQSILCRFVPQPGRRPGDGHSHLPGYRHGRRLCRGGPGRPHLRGLLRPPSTRGVRQGYVQGLLRCSRGAGSPPPGQHRGQHPGHPHTSLVPGDKLTLTVAPKGFGSENMSRLKMFHPRCQGGGHCGLCQGDGGGGRFQPLPAGGAGRGHRRRL